MTRHLFAVADTSVLLTVYNRKDDHHERAVQALSVIDRLVVSPMVLAELDYHLTTRINGRAAADALVSMRAWASTDRLTTRHRGLAPAQRSRASDAHLLGPGCHWHDRRDQRRTGLVTATARRTRSRSPLPEHHRAPDSVGSTASRSSRT